MKKLNWSNINFVRLGHHFLYLSIICSRFAHEGNASRDLTDLISLIWTDFRNVLLIAEAFH